MSLYTLVRNYLLGLRRISGVNILVQKKQISVVRRKTGIPECRPTSCESEIKTFLTSKIFTGIFFNFWENKKLKKI